MFDTKPPLSSAAFMPICRTSTTTYQVCAVCPLFDTQGNAVSPLSGYGLTPPLRDEGLTALTMISFGDLGPGGFITDCFYDNSGALVEGTEFCPPGPVAVDEAPNCLVATK
ncbi:hypothetical protein C8R45DRAFT_927095 [Mycena sanguinolenta]|nr:hypothetical protein C8R45DRAFT_927095 [Mycena sanguinolenta]